jgi:hypothetical protein
VRCACGLPQVIETDPRLPNGEPFPTLWWLTCRELTAAIGRLESGGYIARINESLAGDPRLRAELEDSTKRMLAARDAIERLEDRGHPGGLEHVKCLHAHAAHHLVTGDNPVGRAVLDELDWTDPTEPCV